MDEMMLAGIFALVTSLPGVLLGLALLAGLWRPASLDGARDPDGLRRAVGGTVLAIGGLVSALGLALLLLPRATLLATLPALLGAVLVLAVVLTVVVLRKQRG
ncbi:MAG TPA: hypothetical protein VFQ84_00660 [Arenimonas sp.]|uniref:hypothetical protein n=1 Tax=Arenimonas sp. TaxID=1872635 RepID=UPI002D7E1EA7|nr:hypothetical protein [Arenimonas sp.]HEU0151833.1 hypothetical protein [Arenimonas sp.]